MAETPQAIEVDGVEITEFVTGFELRVEHPPQLSFIPNPTRTLEIEFTRPPDMWRDSRQFFINAAPERYRVNLRKSVDEQVERAQAQARMPLEYIEAGYLARDLARTFDGNDCGWEHPGGGGGINFASFKSDNTGCACDDLDYLHFGHGVEIPEDFLHTTAVYVGEYLSVADYGYDEILYDLHGTRCPA
jgi:hypothetical protein